MKGPVDSLETVENIASLRSCSQNFLCVQDKFFAFPNIRGPGTLKITAGGPRFHQIHFCAPLEARQSHGKHSDYKWHTDTRASARTRSRTRFGWAARRTSKCRPGLSCRRDCRPRRRSGRPKDRSRPCNRSPNRSGEHRVRPAPTPCGRQLDDRAASRTVKIAGGIEGQRGVGSFIARASKMENVTREGE